MQRLTLLAPALAIVLSGCGGGGGGNGAVVTMDQPDMAQAPLPPDMAYPAGPYGNKEGDTVYPFVAKGYPLTVDNTDSASFKGVLTDIPIASIHDNPKCKCLMISISAEWCGPCNMEQPYVVDGVKADPSLCAYEVLIQGQNEASTKLAVQSDLDDWTQLYSHDFPVVLPSTGVLLRLPKANALPTNVFVDPATMQIIKIEQGFNSMASFTAKDLCGL